MFDVLDQLVGPLTAHISATLSQPISGSDDQRAHVETKKAYLALLTNIISAKLQGVFISPSESPYSNHLSSELTLFVQGTTPHLTL